MNLAQQAGRFGLAHVHGGLEQLNNIGFGGQGVVAAVVDVEAGQGQVGLGDALTAGQVKEVYGLFQVQIKATGGTAQQHRQVVGG